MQEYTGFILQTGYRVQAGKAVVQLHGKLREGGSFTLADDRFVPYLWIRAADERLATHAGAHISRESGRRTSLHGEAMVRVDVVTPQETPALRARLRQVGVEAYEADVRFPNRYLIDHGIRGGILIRGPHRDSGDRKTFHNPAVGPADWSPRLSVLSFDIETDPQARRLLSIAYEGCGAAETLLLTPGGYECPANAVACATERVLLRRFLERVRALDPDVLTGWNVIDFDLSVLHRVAGRVGVPLRLGRGDGPLRLLPSGAPGRSQRALVPGRVVLDGIELLRGAFVRVERYGLDAVAKEILGKGKTITGSHRAEEILEAFENDRERLAEYNLNDARLVNEILDRLHLVELSVERSRLTGMTPDRVGASIASFDFLYLLELGRRGRVAPSVHLDRPEMEAGGGHVLEPEPGLHHNVLVLDFKSLYPSVIRTFQIDPAGHVPQPLGDEDLLVAPNGAAFHRDPGILPGILDDLFPRREAAKAAGDKVASQAIKILMNSFYGVLGTRACRFADPALANAITSFGREILLWTKARIEERGLSVLYGDTDSLFVAAGTEDPVEARARAERLVTELDRDLADELRSRYQVRSRLELEFEKLYLKLLLPPMRHGAGGARKRYAGLLWDEHEPWIEFVGMEVVRRDWTDLAKEVQRELYGRLFHDRPVESYLRDLVAGVRAGGRDAQLVYRKSLRKPLDSYTTSTPPHVAAARKLGGRPPRVISYVITRNGPEPIDHRQGALDHEHYVQKQVRPVAEPVLSLLGLDFDRVVGDDRQLSLF